MFIIRARYIFLCDERFTILENKAFVFDERILECGEFELLRDKYPQAKLIQTPPNSLILPAFINTHTHLEFSANAYTLHYGDFLVWLKSVMSARSALSEQAKDELILRTIRTMQQSGTGTLGEISSFGGDLKSCAKSSARIVFFNELLGVNLAQNSTKQAEFLTRFRKSKDLAHERFIPAVSLHSTYSTNRALAEFLLNLAQKEGLLVSTHFLESQHESAWLRQGRGKFKQWLRFADENPRPNYSVKDFVKLFKGQRTLFTHCVYAKDDEFALFDKNLHFLTHCAFSNRLLSRKTFDLKAALRHKMSVNLGTDGLSSNISLSMLDEMRANLLIHSDFKDLSELAKILLLMATRNAAKALNLELGEIKAGKIADFSVFEVGDLLVNAENSAHKTPPKKDTNSKAHKTQSPANQNLSQLPLQFVLNAQFASKLFIAGKQINLAR